MSNCDDGGIGSWPQAVAEMANRPINSTTAKRLAVLLVRKIFVKLIMASPDRQFSRWDPILLTSGWALVSNASEPGSGNDLFSSPGISIGLSNVEDFDPLNRSRQSGEFGNSHAENSPREHNLTVSLVPIEVL